MGVDISSMLSGINSAAGQLGNYVNANKQPLSMGADVLNVIGERGVNSGRGQALNALLKNYLSSQIAGRGLQTPTPTPAPPQKKKITIETEDLNQNGIPDSQEGAKANPLGARQVVDPRLALPQLLSTGGAPVVNPPVSTGGQPAGTPVAAVSAPAVAPVAASPAPVNNLSEADAGNLGWMQGYPAAEGLMKTMATNALTGRERDTQALTAAAHMSGANTAAEEARIKGELLPGTKAHTEAQTALNIQQANDLRAKLTSTGPYSPAAIGAEASAKEKAKAEAEEAVKIDAFNKKRAIASKIPTSKEMQAQGVKDWGQVLDLAGVNAGNVLDTAMMAASTKRNAEIAAGATVKAAWGTVASAAQAALAPFDKMVKELPAGHPMKAIQDVGVASGKITLMTPENISKRMELEMQRDIAINALSKIGEGEAPAAKKLGTKPASVLTKDMILKKHPKATNIVITGNSATVKIDGKPYRIDVTK